MKKPRILVTGSVNMDYTFGGIRFPAEGETVMGDSFSTAAGGKGANQACQAARAGALVDFVGRIGADLNGTELMKSLSGMGIDTSMVITDPENITGCALIELERRPEGTRNRIMVVPGAQMNFRKEELEFLKDRMGQYDMVLLQLEINSEANAAVVRMAHDAGVPVMLNPAPYSVIVREILERISFISPNEHEAFEMTGIRITDIKTAEEAARAIRKMGPKNVLITLGEAGAVFCGEDRFIHCGCVRTDAVDPTAAGDSFVGAFCTAYSAGMDVERALSFASHAASITVSGYGAQPSIPEIGRIAESIREHGSDTDETVLSVLSGGAG